MREIISPLSGIRSPFGGRSLTSPFALFAFGEQGVWFDPSDVANLNWRRNLLTWSQDVSNAVWVGANGWSATNSTTVSASASGASVRSIVSGLVVGQTYTLSMDAQKLSGAVTGLSVDLGDGGTAFLTLPTASVGRLTVTRVVGASGAFLDLVANGAGSFYLSNIQLELGSVATDYQRITDVNTEVIERFPTATLYQDTAGTTPVTTTGQSVGLMLDKSKGLVLGSERITNGTLDINLNGWTLGTDAAQVIPTWTASGVSLARGAGGANGFTQSGVAQVGRTYLITFDVVSGLVAFDAFGVSVVAGAAGSKRYIYTAATTSIQFWPTSNNSTAVVDNISVKELPGNHAVQATTANRPIYGIHPVGGRRNLLVRTEEFDNASWVKSGTTPTADASTDPNGALTADRLTATSASNAFVYQAVALQAGTHTFAIYVKTVSGPAGSLVQITTSGGGSTLASQSFTGTSSWQRVSLTFTLASAQTVWAMFGGASNFVTPQVFDVWGAQLETGSTATAYQRVTDQYNVTEAGVSSVSYLFFDGADDWMITPTITPSVDKAQVFAGVRKLSSALGMILESSSSIGSNNGALYLSSGLNPTDSYVFASRGTTAQGVLHNVGFPISSVVTGIGDISADRITLRLNGSQVGQDTNDQGTGNYLAYPLYIGRRAGTSLPFSGHLYSLIARFGPNLATGQISSTETWVAGKTGIVI
jgi:hypothetical protein